MTKLCVVVFFKIITQWLLMQKQSLKACKNSVYFFSPAALKKNLTIPLLHDVIGCVLHKFSDDQELAMKMNVLLPSLFFFINMTNWKSILQDFL